jgi:drug/metabolite transporter (DMT)-like permease
VMFGIEAAVFLLMAGALAPHLAETPRLLASGPWLAFTLLLTVFCTVTAFTLMNTWQPRITATEAGLIYCLEPVFASLFALFLPGWFSAWAGFAYPNETVTSHLLLGGTLITGANILVQWRSLASAPSPSVS